MQRVVRMLIHVLQAAGTRHLYHGDTPGLGLRLAIRVPGVSYTTGMQHIFDTLRIPDTPGIQDIPCVQQPVLRADQPHQRIADHRTATSSAYRSQQRIQRAFSPISHRRDIATRRRASRLHPAHDRATRRHGIKRALERIHRNEKLHGSSLR